MARYDPTLSPATPAGVFAGVYRRIDVATPPAGADWQLAVAGGTWWRVLLLRAQLATSAAVANRLPVLAISDGDQVLYELPAPAVQAASLTARYSWAPGGPDRSSLAAAGPVIAQAIPDLILPVGGRLTIATTAIDGADAWAGIRAYIQQIEGWPQGPPFGRLDEYQRQEEHRQHYA